MPVRSHKDVIALIQGLAHTTTATTTPARTAVKRGREWCDDDDDGDEDDSSLEEEYSWENSFRANLLATYKGWGVFPQLTCK